MDSYVLKNKRTTLERIEKFISPIYFVDVNIRGRLYPKTSPVSSITHYAAPGRITYAEAVKGEYKPCEVGDAFGPTWSTHWFKVSFHIPGEWLGEEVRLVWESGTEAMVWKEGKPIQGLTSDHRKDFILSRKLEKQDLEQTLHIEMACNTLFGAGKDSMIGPPDPDRKFTLSTCKLAVFDRDVYNVIMDLQILYDLVKFLPEDSNRSYQALYTANEMINVLEVECKDTYASARALSSKFLSQKNGDSQHTVCAIGHCHIDSAWLWPVDETKRKCARSWSSTIKLLEEYPEMTFACSQAQQFAWVKELYPSLYQQITKYVKGGRFIPVGGVWVEMDGNIPSGEAFIRQFLYGQRFFQKEFGILCTEFWLPDTFGYSPQLPQIMQQCGIKRFVTQKLSWSLVNKFPHHTFWWEGIDGSKVLAHFPPGDNYGMTGKVEELMKTINNFKDKGRSNHSMYLYGFGDGGQGPTEDMLESLRRLKNCDGVPKVDMTTPDEFFSKVEKEGKNICKWTGELYLELHNGTYTTQAKTKLMNRRNEFLLQHIELFSTVSWVLQKKTFKYPSDELWRLWQLLLLNQFHDILPGSSIQQVYKDAMNQYHDIQSSGKTLLNNAVQEVLNVDKSAKTKQSAVLANPLSWERLEVFALPSHDAIASPGKNKKRQSVGQMDKLGRNLVVAKIPSMGIGLVNDCSDEVLPVSIEKGDKELIFLENEHIQAVVDDRGRLAFLSSKKAGANKNVFTKDAGNQFVIFDDIPLYWDAWDVMDYHLETRKPVNTPIQYAMIVEDGPLRGTVEVSLKISDRSYIKQTIILDAGCPYLKFETEVHWHENRKFLKVEFPFKIRATQATYEIQHGHVQRPTNFNTSWDWARFEVFGHKWADISEHGLGCAILNDSKYGWSARDNVMRLSLLRSPKAPDAKADMGVHHFTYALMPHSGSLQEAGVIQQAYNLNCPLQLHHVNVPASMKDGMSFFSVDNPAVVLDTVKKAEDRDDAIILRCYEAFGSTCLVKITSTLPINDFVVCNALEQPLEGERPPTWPEGRAVQVQFTPFQIITLMAFL